MLHDCDPLTSRGHMILQQFWICYYSIIWLIFSYFWNPWNWCLNYRVHWIEYLPFFLQALIINDGRWPGEESDTWVRSITWMYLLMCNLLIFQLLVLVVSFFVYMKTRFEWVVGWRCRVLGCLGDEACMWCVSFLL